MEQQPRDELPALPQPRARPAVLAGVRAPGPPLEWEWAAQRLAEAHDYWIASVRPDGRPNCRPVWGLWWPSGFWLATASAAVRDLAANPRITVHLGSTSEVVIVEGAASHYRDPVELVELAHSYSAKYEREAEPTVEGKLALGGSPATVFLVRPETVFGWGEDEKRATAWEFA